MKIQFGLINGQEVIEFVFFECEKIFFILNYNEKRKFNDPKKHGCIMLGFDHIMLKIHEIIKILPPPLLKRKYNSLNSFFNDRYL